jgi:hypothetical protein
MRSLGRKRKNWKRRKKMGIDCAFCLGRVEEYMETLEREKSHRSKSRERVGSSLERVGEC